MLSSTTTAAFNLTEPADTLLNLLVLQQLIIAIKVISSVLKFVIDTLFKPVTFLLPSTIMTLLSVTVPSLTLFNLFNSAAGFN